jgi:hypothetical protein
MSTISHTHDDTDPEQVDLFDLLATIAADTDHTDEHLTPGERFERYHRNNPAIYAVLVSLAREWVARTGRRRVGIKSLVERTRWEIAVRTNDPDYKIGNTHVAFYARLIMAQEPDLAGLFELRPSIADEWIRDRRAA